MKISSKRNIETEILLFDKKKPVFVENQVLSQIKFCAIQVLT